MKRIVITSLLVLGFLQLGMAQKQYKNPLNGIKKVMIEASAGITVEVSSSNELVLEWPGVCDGCDDNGNYNDSPFAREQVQKKRDKAKGLKAIFASGVDNTGLGMQVDQDGEVLRIKDLKPITQRKDFILRIPKGIKLDVNTSTLGSLKVSGFTAELEVTSNVGSIELVDVTGPVTTSTGNIDVIFASVNQNAPISLTTSTGDIDVSLPTSTKTNVEMNSTMGSVFSNFDLEIPRNDGLKPVGGQRRIKGSLNGGGVKISLKSATGDIYLRKK